MSKIKQIIAVFILLGFTTLLQAKEKNQDGRLQPQPVDISQHRPNAPSLDEFINAAVSHSEQMGAERAQEKVVEMEIAIAETGYLPNIQAEAIDSKGFAGSTSALGIIGVIGSPYRSGYGYGVTATQTLWDFGRTSHLTDLARAQFAAQKGRSELTKVDIMQGALDVYLQCALARNERESWEDIAKLSAVVTREIDNYVRTGQRSVVERLLAKTQNDEAVRSIDSLDKRILFVRQRMVVITGRPSEQSDCRPLEEVTAVHSAVSDSRNPLLTQSLLNLNVALEQVNEARAGYRPKLLALASIGDFESARLVPEQNYALGIGLTFPLFDSNVTNTKWQQARAQAYESQHEVLSAQQTVSEVNLKFDEEISAAKVELDHLQEELKDSELAVRIARQRYESMRGTLVDLREAIRNLETERLENGSAQLRLLRAKNLKEIYNGQKF
jgi:outer membrane protein TolC